MRNHLKIYLKYIIKKKLYSFVLVFGFAISLMFVFMLSVYIHQELAIDQSPMLPASPSIHQSISPS